MPARDKLFPKYIAGLKEGVNHAQNEDESFLRESGILERLDTIINSDNVPEYVVDNNKVKKFTSILQCVTFIKRI